MKVLILFAHPAFHKSHVNKVLVDGLSQLEHVTFHDLYEEYPDFDIDIKREQELLMLHDCIIFHHPLFWNSTPALLKEWQDLVLEHGWAFGSKGNALKGKLFFNVITAGRPKLLESKITEDNPSINQLILPIKQTAFRCKMIPLPPFVVYGTHAIQTPEILEHKRIYSELLRQFTRDEIQINKALIHSDLNDYITNKNR